jgi:hypothetical protein
VPEPFPPELLRGLAERRDGLLDVGEQEAPVLADLQARQAAVAGVLVHRLHREIEKAGDEARVAQWLTLEPEREAAALTSHGRARTAR